MTSNQNTTVEAKKAIEQPIEQSQTKTDQPQIQKVESQTLQSQQSPPQEEKKIYVTTKETSKLTRELYLDISKIIYYGDYKNQRIGEEIQNKCKDVVQSYYFMQGSLGFCLAYFGGKILFQKKQRFTKNNLDMIFTTLLCCTAGFSGYLYSSRFQQDLGKFKSINIVEYKKEPENYIKYLLEE